MGRLIDRFHPRLGVLVRKPAGFELANSSLDQIGEGGHQADTDRHWGYVPDWEGQSKTADPERTERPVRLLISMP